MSDFYEEACYLSNSEAEPDSETEDVFTTTISNRTTCQEKHIKKEEAVIKPELAWDDPQALLNTWLGELDNLNMGAASTSYFDHLPVQLPVYVTELGAHIREN